MHTPTFHAGRHRFGLTLLALACCTLAQAQATDAKPADTAAEKRKAEPETLEIVTVNASRRVEPLHTAPLSATALSGDVLVKASVSVLEQLQSATPPAAANNFGHCTRWLA